MENWILNDPELLRNIGILLGIVVASITIWTKTNMSKWIVIGWDKTFGKAHADIRKNLKIQGDMLGVIAFELKSNGRGTINEQLERIEEQGHDTYALTGASLHVSEQAQFVTDKFGKVTSNNYKHQMLTGFSADQVSEDQWILVIDPDDRDMVFRKWNEAVDQERDFSEDIWYVTPHGHRYKVHVKAARQLDKNGKLRGWLGVVTPLDEYGRKVCAFSHESCEIAIRTIDAKN